MDSIEVVLERMVDNLIAYNEISFLDDVQFIWRRAWSIENVQDPKEVDPLRYALKACLLERMAEIWSSPPKNVKTSAPDWCKHVPAIKNEFSVVRNEYRAIWANDLASPVFQKRNIFAPKEFMFFL